MVEKSLITIIVPVYKTEKFSHKYVDRILFVTLLETLYGETNE